MNTIVIVGVGLMGGSIGLAAKQRNAAREIIGVARRQSTIDQAVELGAITRGTRYLSEAVVDADLIVICTPVSMIADQVLEVAASCRPGTLITDAGSTKAEIVSRVAGNLPDGIEFVGGHPLAGSHASGVAAASADIYDGCVTLITPTSFSSALAIEGVEKFWQSLGSRTVRIDAESHDEVLAITSHLPHVVASSLAAATPTEYLNCTAGGWRDCTRIAAADCQLWEEILLANAQPTLAAIKLFASHLDELTQALETGDAARLTKALEQGKRHRDALGS